MAIFRFNLFQAVGGETIRNHMMIEGKMQAVNKNEHRSRNKAVAWHTNIGKNYKEFSIIKKKK